MSGDHNEYQKDKSYLDFECPRCGHCCYVDDDDTSQERVDETAKNRLNREDIILMAREAGMTVCREEYGWRLLERFAALVANEKQKQIIDILRRLQERNDSHNYYGYAINVIKGEK